MIVQAISYSSNDYTGAITNNENSTIKNNLDSWYKNNLTNYVSYLSDETFCNDRTVVSGTGYLTIPTTNYGAYNRLYEKRNPSLVCAQSSDKFRVSNEIAKLDYSISLITADETVLAGSVYNLQNNSYYLYNGQDFFTLSPVSFYSGRFDARVYIINSAGILLPYGGVSSSYGVRPVINLRSDVTIANGDGTALNPFVIQS